LFGHHNTVNSVVFVGDGRTALSGSNDDTLGVWDVRERKLLRVLAGHSDGVTAVIPSRDGTVAASASSDTTLRLWDLREPGPEGKPDHPARIVDVIAIGRGLVSASEWQKTSTLCLWDRRGKLLRQIVTKEWTECMAVCPDGKLIIAGMGIYLCNLAGRPHFRYLGGNRGSGHTLSALVLTPDGRYLIDAGWEGARLWDLSPLQRGEYPEPLDLDLYTFWLAVSPDARWLLGSCKGVSESSPLVINLRAARSSRGNR